MNENLKCIAMVAMTSERVIGKGNDLPWYLPEDLKLFKKTTSGHPIVMGRKTFESIGRPLPKRQNIVLTRDQNWQADGVDVIHSAGALTQLDLQSSKVYIIGGAEIYKLFLPHLDEILVSFVYSTFPGDTYFPEFEDCFTSYEVIEKFTDFEFRRYSKS
jgi:dihydrofolate reductase